MTSTKTTVQSATPASESVGGRVIDNAASGERIVIRKSGADTGGRVLAFDLFLRPGGHVPAGHVHPVQEERFTVIQGRMRFRLGRRTVLVGPGETVRIPAGTPHWFGNVGPDVPQIGVEVRPALRMEELLQRTGSLGTDGHFPGTHIPRLSDLAVVLLEFQRELAVPNVPAFLVRAVMAPLGLAGAPPGAPPGSLGEGWGEGPARRSGRSRADGPM
jgi:quercetin dioxygenase-like cupin family protein